MEEVYLPRITPERARFDVARMALADAKTAPLLLGAPGVGKSVTTEEAAYLIAKLYAIVSSAGSGPDVFREYVENAARDVVKALTRYVSNVPEIYRDSSIVALEDYLGALNEERRSLLVDLALAHIEKTIEDAKKERENKEEISRLVNLLIEKLVMSFAIDINDPKSAKEAIVNVARKIVAESAVRAAIANDSLEVKTRGILLYYDSKAPEELYRNSIVYINFNVSSMTESDLTGIPSISYGGATTLWPKWALAAKLAHFAIINLDEVTNKMPDVMKSALYNIVLNKQTGTFYFGKFVTGTGNTIRTSSLVGTLPGPLFTGRFSQYLIVPPTLEEWKAFMDRTYGDKWFKGVYTVIKVVRNLSGDAKFGQVVSKLSNPFKDPFSLDEDEYVQFSKIKPGLTPAFPSPRAWTAVSLYLQKVNDKADRYSIEDYVTATVGMPGMARVLSAMISMNEINVKQLIKEEIEACSGVIEALESNVDPLSFAESLGTLIGIAYMVVSWFKENNPNKDVRSLLGQIMNELRVAGATGAVADLLNLIHEAILY